MNQKACHVTFPTALVVVMAAFLSVLFFANANSSFAASSKKKPAAVAVTSAVDQTEARIKQLQGTLKITESQEGLWTSLTTVMRENAKEMDVLIKDRAENSKTMNAVESLKLHSRFTEVRVEQMKKFLPPFEALYASMSDEQKKNTDTLFRSGRLGKKRTK